MTMPVLGGWSLGPVDVDLSSPEELTGETRPSEMAAWPTGLHGLQRPTGLQEDTEVSQSYTSLLLCGV